MHMCMWAQDSCPGHEAVRSEGVRMSQIRIAEDTCAQGWMDFNVTETESLNLSVMPLCTWRHPMVELPCATCDASLVELSIICMPSCIHTYGHMAFM